MVPATHNWLQTRASEQQTCGRWFVPSKSLRLQDPFFSLGFDDISIVPANLGSGAFSTTDFGLVFRDLR
jgi:hypothetical protein